MMFYKADLSSAALASQSAVMKGKYTSKIPLFSAF
jgi:hypothetical protein